MEFDKDFSEFVALLARHNVRYMIVGGYALAAHGLPRATGDLDDLIANKLAVGRPQDVADVLRLTGDGGSHDGR